MKNLADEFIQLPRTVDEERLLPVWQVQFDALKTITPMDISLVIKGDVIFGVGQSDDGYLDLSDHFNDILGVSHHHFKVIPSETELLIVDLNSTNGTRLNGKLIEPNQPYSIYDGDILELGNLMIAIKTLSSPKAQIEVVGGKTELVHALSHLSTLLATNLNLDDTLARILDTSLKLTRSDGGALMLRDVEADGELFLKLNRGVDDSKIDSLLKDNLELSAALRTGEPVRHNTSGGRKYKFLGNRVFEAVLYVPLIVGDDTLGALVVIRNNDGDGFEPEDAYALRMIGKLAAITVHNYEKENGANKAVQKKIAEHFTYQKILQTLLTQNDLVGIYSELRRLIRERWVVDNVGLWLLDNVSGKLEPYPKPSFHKAYSIGEDLIGTVAGKAEPILAHDIKIYSDTNNSPAPTLQLLARSAVYIPLLDGSKVLGVLAVFSIKENEYNQDDVTLLTTYSQAAVEVIRKALLFEQVEKQKATILAAANMLQHPLMIIDQEGKLIMSNKAANALIGELQSTLFNVVEQPGRITSPSLSTFLYELSSSKSSTKEIIVGDKVYVVSLESAAMVGTIILMQDVTDPVTGMFSHHHYHVLAEQVFVQAKRYRKPLATLVVGFKDFKGVLEHQGYAVGNQALKELAIRLRSCLRTSDILGRYQDENFVIILPETELANATTTARRILHQLKENPIVVEKGRSISKPAIGVALLDFDSDASIDDLIKKADQAFLSAKTHKKENLCILNGNLK